MISFYVVFFILSKSVLWVLIFSKVCHNCILLIEKIKFIVKLIIIKNLKFVKFCMRKISFQKIVLIFSIIVFIVGIFTGDIKFEIKKKNNYRNDIEIKLQNIENVTWKLYYSPDNSWWAFYESFSNIETSLKLQTYEFTEKNIKSKLKELLEKWVDVKVIMENYKYKQFQNTWKQIAEYFTGYDNFEIKSDDQMWTEYIHSKINLVDSGFWIQTANLTHSSFNKNREHFFYSTNTWVWYSLNNIFDKDWNGEKIFLDDIHPNLVICNINCRDVIELLLEWAEKSILIQTQYIVDKRILDILKSKVWLDKSSVPQNAGQLLYKGAQKSFDIRFIVSDTETSDDLLKYFGPAVARKFNQYYNHTKMILIDEEILLLWSMNLSDNSLDNNREIGILIIDLEIIKKYKELFEIDWKKSRF